MRATTVDPEELSMVLAAEVVDQEVADDDRMASELAPAAGIGR